MAKQNVERRPMGLALAPLARRAVDFMLSHLGPGGINIYLRLCGKAQGKGRIGHKVFMGLASLPAPSQDPQVSRVSMPLCSFFYVSDSRDDLVVSARWSLTDWEPISRAVFSELCLSAHHIVDVGAYSGVYSLIAASSNSKSLVTAFEPNPAIRPLLERNIARNSYASRVRVRPLALSRSRGRAALYQRPGGSNSSTLSLSEGVHVVDVMQSTLDEEFEAASIDLLKIDVEGGEADVLEGGLQVLSRCQPIILCEALSPAALNQQSRILTRLGYEAPVPLSHQPGSSDVNNYLWFTRSQLEHVQEISVTTQTVPSPTD